MIYVTNNPRNPNTSKEHKECHRLSSKEGIVLMPEIDKYIKNKHKYEGRLSTWYSHYTFDPPVYEMPYRSGRRLNYEFFRNCPENANTLQPKYPIVYRGNTYYSKNEVLTVLVTERLGLDFKSEVPVKIDEFTTYPVDGLIGCKEADFSMFIEIMGMTDRTDYMQKNYQKIVDFSSVGLRQNQEILYIFVPNSYEFDFENLEMQIMMSIERSIKDPVGWTEGVVS